MPHPARHSGFLAPARVPALLAGLALALSLATAPAQQPPEQQLVDLANQSRAQANLPPLAWDESLAAAARAHAQLMAASGSISHRYQGEPDLAQRAAQSGAHFSLIEENVAMGYSPAQIHSAWMHSPGHHDNLLNPAIDRIGVALVSSHGLLYAVADYAKAVQSLTPAQIESKVAALLRARGLTLLPNPSAARQYCAQDSGGPSRDSNARFLMRWQSAQIATLPPELESRIATGTFHQATVGACPLQSETPNTPVFSGYRVAVLLY